MEDEVEASLCSPPVRIVLDGMPSTAVNDVEMSQAQTFDPETIKPNKGVLEP